jgi:hypothetical protein
MAVRCTGTQEPSKVSRWSFKLDLRSLIDSGTPMTVKADRLLSVGTFRDLRCSVAVQLPRGCEVPDIWS